MALPRRRRPAAGPQAVILADGADWRTRYTIENPAEVDAYVRRHPSLNAILAEAPVRVQAAFEESPHLVMRHETDEDREAPGDGLVVDIVTHGDASSAQDRLAHFDAHWWLTVLPGIVRDGATVVFLPRFV